MNSNANHKNLDKNHVLASNLDNACNTDDHFISNPSCSYSNLTPINISKPLTTTAQNIIVQENKDADFLKHLTSWAVKTTLSHNSFNELLILLRLHTSIKGIPKDCRTLLKFDTSIKKAVIPLPPGQYYHFGIKEGLLQTLKQLPDFSTLGNTLNISINIDGLPLTKSSCSQFWPILGHLDDIQESMPFPIGVFQGNSKPNDSNMFLSWLTNEFISLKTTGLNINGTEFKLKILKILCDAPAKAFVLNVKSHNSYHSCTKCKVEGDYINHRMSFLSTDSSLRNHLDVLNLVDEDYHKGATSLRLLDIDLVNDIPLDYMHLVCLGVTKKLLTFWVSGPQGVRLFKEDLEGINAILETCRKSCVKEFARLPRPLKELDRWKATEFRDFLLYHGLVALKNFLKEPMWSHFLSLHVAIRILVSPKLTKLHDFIQYAKTLLEYFINKFAEIYGQEYVNHNVHNLIHLINDVKRFGPLDNFSCFRFENYMYQIKKTLKTSNFPLQQFINRYYEYNTHYITSKNTDEYVLSSALECTENIGECHLEIHSSLQTLNFYFSTKRPNCFAMLKSGTPIQFLGFYLKDGKYYFKCKYFDSLKSIFKIPCDSLQIHCGLVDNLSNDEYCHPINDIECKAIIFNNLLLPLLHLF